MNKYLVKSVDGKYTIEADLWTVGKEGLIFWRIIDPEVFTKTPLEANHETVAWFTSWDYWMLLLQPPKE